MARVLSTPIATAELNQILESVRLKNRSAARRLRHEFRRTFRIIGRQPDIGTLCEHFGKGLRYVSVENYVVLFRRANDHVDIVGVVHGARDWEKLY